MGRTAWIGVLSGFLLISIAGAARAAPGDVTVSQVADINPGLVSSTPQELIDVGGTLLFAATDVTHGTELWKSNGGPLGAGGTEMVANIESGSGGSGPQGLTNIGGTVFFRAFTSSHGSEVWKVPPPYTSPVEVKDVNTGGGSNPSNLINVNGTLFFLADDGVNGEELWKSVPPYDAASTDMVKDINTSGSSSPNGLFNANGTLLFDADDGGGSALWKSESPYDAAHTTKLPGGVSFPAPYANAGGAVLFGAVVGGDFELWKMTGPPFTTPVLVKNINPSGDSNIDDLVNVNGTVFFTATDGGAAVGSEVWKSVAPFDAASTTPLDINSGTGDSDPAELSNVGGQLFFSAGDGVHGIEPWRSNGGPVGSGTDLVADVVPSFNGSNPREFTDVNGTAFFPAFETAGPNLFKSTGVGATKVSSQFTSGSAPQLLTNVAGTLFFAATDSATTTGQELWKATIEPAPPPAAAPPTTPTPALVVKKKCKKNKKKHKRAAAAKKCKKKKKKK